VALALLALGASVRKKVLKRGTVFPRRGAGGTTRAFQKSDRNVGCGPPHVPIRLPGALACIWLSGRDQIRIHPCLG